MKYFYFLLFAGFVFAANNEQITMLADTLYHSCQQNNCEFEFVLQENELKNFVAKPSQMSTRNKCAELCSACFSNSADASKCIKVEQLCQCSENFSHFNSDTLADDSSAKASSLESQIEKLEATQNAANDIFTACEKFQNCEVKVNLNPNAMNIQNLQAKDLNAPVDTVKTDSLQQNKENGKDSLAAIDTTNAKKDSSLKNVTLRKKKFYGLTLAYGENEEQVKSSYDDVFNTGKEIIFGYAFRKYWCRYWEYQLGVNWVIGFNEFSGTSYNGFVKLSYVKHAIEIPITYRFMIANKSRWTPFFIASTTIRKPLFGFFESKVKTDGSETVVSKEFTDDFNINNWELFFHLGSGIEWNQKYSVELKYGGGANSGSPAIEPTGDFGFQIQSNILW